MKTPNYSRQFGRDLKRCSKRGYDMGKFKDIALKLLADEPLPDSMRPHPLVGNYVGYFDCHLSGDWVLMYKTTSTAVIFQRMGTHSDLFE